MTEYAEAMLWILSIFSLIDFPVFNIADMYVVCSGILLVMLVCFRYKNDEDYDFLRIKRISIMEFLIISFCTVSPVSGLTAIFLK